MGRALQHTKPVRVALCKPHPGPTPTPTQEGPSLPPALEWSPEAHWTCLCPQAAGLPNFSW